MGDTPVRTESSVFNRDTKKRKAYVRRDLPQKWKKILVFLMNAGPANRNEIRKSISDGQSYSPIYKAVRNLTNSGLISSVSKSRGRRGRPVATYDLTVPGLAFTLDYLRRDAQWDEIAREHKDSIPRVFGKWEHFVNEGGEELAKKSLMASIGIFWSEYDWDAGCTNEQAARKISKYFIMTPRYALTQRELSKWYRILAKDKQLKSWATGHMEGIIVKDLDEVEYWSMRLYDLRGSYPKRLTNRIKDVMEKTLQYPQLSVGAVIGSEY